MFQRDDVGRIKAVYDPSSLNTSGNPVGPAAVQYFYDDWGNLSQVSSLVDKSTGAYDTTTFFYEKSAFPHYITRIVDPRGIEVARTEYYDSTDPEPANIGKIKSIKDAKGRVTSFAHKTGGFATGRPTGYGTPVVREEITFTPVAGGASQVTVHEADERGNVICSIDPSGFTNWSNYGPRTGVDRSDPKADWLLWEQQYTVTEQGGSRTYLRNWEYPDTGTTAQRLAPTKVTDLHLDSTPVNQLRITRYEYNALGQATNVFSPKYSQPGSGVYQETKHDEDANSPTYGQVLTQKFHGSDPVPATGGQVLSENVYITTAGSPLRGQLWYSFDAQRNVTLYQYYTGGTGGRVGDLGTVTAYPAGTNPQNPGSAPYLSTTSYTYDDSGNRLKEVRWKHGSPDVPFTTSYDYDAKGRVKKTTDPSLATSETSYNSLGKVATTTDRYNATTTYRYDRTGDLSETLYADETVVRQATAYANGGALGLLRCQVVEDRHSLNQTGSITGTRTIYNAVGRVIRSERVKNLAVTLARNGDICDTSYTYNPAQTSDILARTLTEYLADGRIAKTAQDLDLDGAISSGDPVTAYEYSADGLTKTTIPPDVQDGTDNIHTLVEETSDLNGNVLTTQTKSYRGGNLETHRPVTGYVYDQLNRRKETWSYPDEGLSGGVQMSKSLYDWSGRVWLSQISNNVVLHNESVSSQLTIFQNNYRS